MNDHRKSKSELIAELRQTKSQLQELQAQLASQPAPERGLELASEFYQTLLDNLPSVAILIFDLELRYILAVGTGLETYGFSKQSVEGRTVTEVLSPELNKLFVPCYEGALVGNESIFNFNYGHCTCLVQIRPVKNQQGEIVAGLAFYQDVTEQIHIEAELNEYREHFEVLSTERKTEWVSVNEKLLQEIVEREWVEEALQKIKKRYELAIKAGKVGVWDWDLWSYEIYFDPFLQTTLGFSDSEINSLDDWIKHVHPDDAGRVRSTVQAHQAGGAPSFELEHRILHRDGSIRWFLVRGSTLVDESGKPYRLIGTNTDITEIKEAETALREAHQALFKKAADLESANTELAQYAYVVSHDLKTPLRAIHNYADFLFEDLAGTLAGDQNEYLGGLMEAVAEAEALVDDLLELSRIGRRDVPVEVIDLKIFLQDIIESLDISADAEITLAEYWPTIRAQAPLLRQIFQNLLQNALKFNRSSPKVVSVDWRSVPDEQTYEFFVQDNGIGINPQYQDRVFQVFQRLHTHDEYPGTGIGLAIVKKAAEKLRGSVRLESEEGQGSTFFVTLPKAQQGL